jgi:type I restriction enzyme R subunit
MNKKGYNELNISQAPALEVLERIGYQIIQPEEAELMRENLYNVILKPIIKTQLEKINSYEYKDQIHHFSASNIQKAMQDIDMALTDGLI